MTPEIKCPTCRKPAQEKFTPFCSNRCAFVDLHRWFGEAYRAPTQEQAESEIVPESTETEA